MLKNFAKLALVCTFILFVVLQGGLFSAPGTTSSLFLKIPVGSRPIGMGSAFTSVANDIHSIYWNPAGLGQVENNEFMFTHNDYIEDLKMNYVAFCHPLRKYSSSIGIAITQFDAGSFQRTVFSDTIGGRYEGSTFSAKDISIVFSQGFKLPLNNYNFGYSLKFISSKIDNYEAKTYAIDLGFLYIMERSITNLELPLNIGITVNNIGNKLKYNTEKEKLPLNYKIGLSSLFQLNNRYYIIPVTDFIFSSEDKFNIALGVELKYLYAFSFRTGYNNISDIGSGFSFGLGYNTDTLGLDYSYTDYSDLGVVHRFCLSIKFSL